MRKKGGNKTRSVMLQLLLAMPALTVALALLGAKLLLGETLREERLPLLACGIAGITAFALCLYCALRMPQKKMLWGILTAGFYGCLLMLGNLLFFGVGYGGVLQTLAMVLGAGLLGSVTGAAKRRKYA